MSDRTTLNSDENKQDTSSNEQDTAKESVTADEVCASIFGASYENVNLETEHLAHFYAFDNYLIYAQRASFTLKSETKTVFSVPRSHYLSFFRALHQALLDFTKEVPENFYRKVEEESFVVKGYYLKEPQIAKNYFVVIFANQQLVKILKLKHLQKFIIACSEAVLCSICADVNTELAYKQLINRAATEEQNANLILLLKLWGQQKNMEELVKACKTISSSDHTVTSVCRLIMNEGVLLSVMQKVNFRLKK